MKFILLKLSLLFFVLCLLSLAASAQDPRFIYIQTDNKEPFYVKIDKTLLNSSPTSYIIIPKLVNDSYQLTIGFFNNEWPELNVTVSVKDANAGFLLKNSGEKGWALFNLLSMKSVAVEKQVLPTKEVETVTSTDEFARILAEVVNDPSIGQVIVEKKAAEVTVKTDDVKAVKTPVVKEEIKAIPVKLKGNDEVITPKPEIKKLVQDTTQDGLLMTYRENADTIKIFMPVSKTEIEDPDLKRDSASKIKEDVVITEKKTVADNSNEKLAATGLNANKVMINRDCKRSATQNDFLKLSKTMAAEANEKSMTKAAIKQFISTCYTAEQVKILGALFITQEEKYKFFVAAFPHVWDAGNFKALEDQLSDEYYKTRFKAMFSH
ncbi:MAG: DUF4476 domain-containing protein [Ferruginibacter sp.]